MARRRWSRSAVIVSLLSVGGVAGVVPRPAPECYPESAMRQGWLATLLTSVKGSPRMRVPTRGRAELDALQEDRRLTFRLAHSWRC
jgi:hypothetical protein